MACSILAIALGSFVLVPSSEAEEKQSHDESALDIVNDALKEADLEESDSSSDKPDSDEAQQQVNNWWDLVSEELPIFIAAIVIALSSSIVGLGLPKLGGAVIDLTKQGNTPDLIKVALKLAGTLGLYAGTRAAFAFVTIVV